MKLGPQLTINTVLDESTVEKDLIQVRSAQIEELEKKVAGLKEQMNPDEAVQESTYEPSEGRKVFTD